MSKIKNYFPDYLMVYDSVKDTVSAYFRDGQNIILDFDPKLEIKTNDFNLSFARDLSKFCTLINNLDKEEDPFIEVRDRELHDLNLRYYNIKSAVVRAGNV